jgi:hypothetical protein
MAVRPLLIAQGSRRSAPPSRGDVELGQRPMPSGSIQSACGSQSSRKRAAPTATTGACCRCPTRSARGRCEPSRVRWRLRGQDDLSWQKEGLPGCPALPSTPTSFVSEACASCSRAAVQSRMSLAISACTAGRCAYGSAKPKPTRACAPTGQRGAHALEGPREREPRAASGQRDPQGGQRFFRSGARSDPAEAVNFIDADRARFGSSRSAGSSSLHPARTTLAARGRPLSGP